jgi:hypothetical protein
MKYKGVTWGRPTVSVTVGPDIPLTTLADYEPHIVAQFPVNPPGDVERRERAIMLAKKLVDFLNEFEEKKAQVADLMKIAAS